MARVLEAAKDLEAHRARELAAAAATEDDRTRWLAALCSAQRKFSYALKPEFRS